MIHKEPDKIIFDLIPDKSMDELDAFLLERMNRSSNKQLNHILEMMIPKRLVQYIMDRLNIDDSLKANETTKVQRRSISELLKCLDFEVSSFAGFDQAMITVGPDEGRGNRELYPGGGTAIPDPARREPAHPLAGERTERAHF